VKKVDVVTFCRNIEFVIIAEELGLSTAGREEMAAARGGFLENRFKDLKHMSLPDRES
jgi:hypothetical protein